MAGGPTGARGGPPPAAPHAHPGLRRRSVGVRPYLLSLVMVCLVPASLLAGITLAWAFLDGRQALIEQATLESRAIGRTVDATLTGAISGLEALAASPALARGDFTAFHDEAQRALPYQLGNNIVLSDATGQQLVNTLTPSGRPLPRHGAPAFQRSVLLNGRPAVSDLFLGGVLRSPVVAVEVPVRQGNRVTHTLAMGFVPERFAAILAQQAIEPDRVVSIFDSHGVIVARTHDAKRYVGHKGAPALVRAMASGPNGVVNTPTLEGIPVIAAYTRSSVTGWTVAVGVPRQVLLARLERWTGWLALSGLALLVLSMVAAQALARRISGAFGALIPAAQALGEGQRVDPMPMTVAEAEAVAEALARASRLLHARTQERDAATEATEAERTRAQRFAHAARHDPLTGLVNRAQFVHLLNDRLAQCRDHAGHLCVVFIDVDNFKPINDRHGHAVGDELLRAFASRLHTSVRGDDVVARLGGDEFAMLIGGQGPSEIQATAASLVDRLSRPYAIRDLTVEVSASVGIASYPEHGESAQALLEAADAAMYRAKGAGKSRYAVSGFMPL